MPLPTQTRIGLSVLILAAVLLVLRIGYDVVGGQPVSAPSGEDVALCVAGAVLVVGVYHGWQLTREGNASTSEDLSDRPSATSENRE